MSYTYTTLNDPLAVNGTYVTGVNGNGQIVGYYVDGSGNDQGFIYSGGIYTTLVGTEYWTSVNGGAGSTVHTGTVAIVPEGINKSGEIVGYIPAVNFLDQGLPFESFTYQYGTTGAFSAFELGFSNEPLNQTIAQGINNQGQVVGYANVPGISPVLNNGFEFGGSFSSPYYGGSNSYLIQSSSTLEYPNSTTTEPNSVNNQGEVVGSWIGTDPNVSGVTSHGFIYTSGVYLYFDDPSGINGTFAQGINDSGLIVGYYLDQNALAHGFEYSETTGTFTTIDVPSAAETYLYGVNDAGEIVGSYVDGSGITHGFDAATAPAVTVTSDSNATRGQTLALSSLVTISDPDSVGYQTLELWDTNGTVGGGQFVVNGVAESGGHEIDVTPANVANTVFDVGLLGGTDTLYARLLESNGTLTAWQPFTVSAPLDQAPVTTATSVSVTATHGETSALASSLFTVSDAVGNAVTTYAFYDATGNGHWVVNGVAQATATEIYVSAANLSQVSYVFGPTGSAPDTLYVRASDGYLWGNWTPFTATPGPDTAPVVSASSVVATHGETSVAASSLFSVSDADNDTMTQYEFYDATGNGSWVVNGVTQAAQTIIPVAAANLSQVSYAFGTTGSAPDTLYIRANDGYEWGNWTPFTATPPPDHAPVVTASSVTATHGETSALASSLFTVSDADNDTMTQYEFYDATGNGSWVVNGVTQAAQTIIPVAAANLSQVSYAFGTTGSAPDTLYIRANDGYEWGNWTPFTATPPPDHAPVVTASNLAAAHNQSLAASSLFSVTDADGDSMTRYDFYDATGNGHFVLNGVAQPTATIIDITAAQLANLSYQSGSGTDQLYVRAFDGDLWSAWTPFTVTAPIDQAPVVMAPNAGVAATTSVAASSLFTVSDPEGDSITTYDFYDATGSGHFVVNGTAEAAGTIIPVTAAQLAQTSYVAGSANDLLYVRASDGTMWSAWTPFTAGPAPTVTASNIALAAGISVAASSLFTATDGGTFTQYDFYDATGNGHFVVNGTSEATATIINIAAAQLAQTNYVGGAGTDQLYVRAFDGTNWSAWTPFTAGPSAPTVTASNVSIGASQSVVASSLFTATDTDGGSITAYDFYDATGSGHFVVNGTTEAAATIIPVTSAQLAQTSYVAGTGPDQLYVRAFEGTLWSNWVPFTAGPTPPLVTAPNVSTVPGQTIAAADLFSATDGGTITDYNFYDATGNGHFTVNGTTQATASIIDVSPANLAQTDYASGNGSDQLYVRANDGTAWSAWQPFTVASSTPAIVNAGATLELGTASAAAVTFFASTGTLELDNSSSFSGTVAGMTANDTIDFADINFASIQTPTFAGNSSSGTLHVTDGTHTASIALLGNYMASTFVASSDGHGGTSVVDPQLIQQSTLAQPQHA